MAMNYQMDSIWIEEDKEQKKFHVNDPNIELINSTTPILLNKNNIELPPLPPTSYFQHALDDLQAKRKKEKNKIINMFKKLSLTTKEEPIRPRRKISTPFEFKHVSHVNPTSPITRKTFEMPIERSRRRRSKHRSSASHPDSISTSQAPMTPNSKNSAIAFNTTAPHGRLDSTIENVSLSLSFEKHLESPSSARLPRSSSGSTDIFTRSDSMSTMATSVSRIKSKKHQHHTGSIDEEEPHKKQLKETSHIHTNSSSSIENLKMIEKTQISKQCSIDYTSNFTFPTSLESWGTPDPESAVRQSWIYEELSPFKTLKRSNSISHSPSRANETPLIKQELNLFQNEMEALLDKNEIECRKIIETIDDFKNMLKVKTPVSNKERFDLSTVSPLNHEMNEAYSSFILPKVENEQRYGKFKREELNFDAFNITTSSSVESTPKQHYTSTLLPSIIN